jgi:hypothetical protein
MSFHTDPTEAATMLARMKGISIDDALQFLGGKSFANKAQWDLIHAAGGAKGVMKGGLQGGLARAAGSKLAHGALRAVPIVGAGLAGLDAADIVTNNTSLGNKGMDAAAMAIGGTLGSVGGPLGALAGASTGKWASDSLQWLFGDKKTPEQRKLEEALIALRGGVV